MSRLSNTRRNAVFSLLIVIALAFGLLVSIKLTAHASGAAAITLSPTFGPQTSSVTVNGTGFGASEGITINLQATQVATTTTDTTGAFKATFTIPAVTFPGNRTVKATGSTSQLFATATFLVQSDWPVFGYDSTHSHLNPIEEAINRADVRHVTYYWAPTPGGSPAVPRPCALPR